MVDKLVEYQGAEASLPGQNRLWPLYGAGLENLGQQGAPIQVPMPEYGPDELLVRHDAVGLCFSDIKVIRLGDDHPRIYRDMQAEPVTLGHEVTMTVVGVGQNLRDQYQVGDRFIIQADVFVDGVGYAYGYEIQGGLSQYNVIDQRVLDGDDGNYLIPVQPGTGYAEAALTEPWACVIAAYQLTYRTGLKPGGTAWIIGAPSLDDKSAPAYTISQGFDQASHPDQLLLSGVPTGFAAWLRERAEALGVNVIDVDDLAHPPLTPIDDIILLGADPGVIEAVSPHLGHFGVMALLDSAPMPRPVAVDVGRVHYDRWVYVGGTGPDIAQAYSATPVRSTLKPGGKAWFVGAGGPMGRMHVQRAVEAFDGPKTIFCTALSDRRLSVVRSVYEAEAEAKSIAFTCASRTDDAAYERALETVAAPGFDDIVVLAPDARAVAEAADYVAPGGVINIFAGLARGTMVPLDLSDVYLKEVRMIGHSGSTLDDMRMTLQQVESGRLSPNRLVAAIGSLGAAYDGLRAVKDAVFPGKIVIYPHIKEFPLTALSDLESKLPSVYAKLRGGREWTNQAEEKFLRLMLP